MVFQIYKEADKPTNINDEGVVTFTERGIYVGLDGANKVLYDGMSHEQFMNKLLLDSAPVDNLYEGRQYINKTDGCLYVYYNQKWNKISGEATGGGGVGDIINIIGEQYVAGNNITITDNPDGTKSINANDMTFTGFNVVTSVPTSFDTVAQNSLLFVI